jgi:sugar fermentation stimulation protein A
MKNPELIQGRFLRRDNRFRATVRVAGRDAWAHVPNSGRLAELFVKDRPIWLSPATTPRRKTAYDLKLVQKASTLVSVDARLPNPLFAEALADGRLPGFSFPTVKREVTYNHSRLDFQLSGPAGICWVETKSVTLIEEGTALFPDAPTSRGRRHLETLMELKDKGHQAAVVFVIQRPDAHRFAPYHEADPDFTIALNKASAAGVEVRAFTCQVSLSEIAIAGEIPVRLAGTDTG